MRITQKFGDVTLVVNTQKPHRAGRYSIECGGKIELLDPDEFNDIVSFLKLSKFDEIRAHADDIDTRLANLVDLVEKVVNQ